MRAEEFITEHEMVFSRTGNKLKTKWRCTSGPRNGRVVSNAKDCDAPIGSSQASSNEEDSQDQECSSSSQS